jgi:SAM-dependent methyltransferase
MMASKQLTCHTCGGVDLHEITAFKQLTRVTSDCKPFAAGGRLQVCMDCGAAQKPADATWQTDCDAIYETYQPYYQSGGVEQAVYDPVTGAPRRRSQVIVDRISAERGLGPKGSVIDVGCGNGVLLTAFGAAKPGWKLFGHELSELNLPHLKTIPGFEKLFTGYPIKVDGRFDVVTMMHSLEHFADPLEGLTSLKGHIAEGGCLFVEVPNGAATPFDLLVADHASHFTRHDLARLAARAGMGAPVIADDWVTKELSFVATPSGKVCDLPPAPTPAECLARVNAQVAWLLATVQRATEAAKKSKPFGIFGTSVAAMWLFGQIGADTAFFIDEDPSRKNATLFDRPIYTPAEAPEGATVYVALIPEVAARVAKRVGRPGLNMIVLPSVGSYAA